MAIEKSTIEKSTIWFWIFIITGFIAMLVLD